MKISLSPIKSAIRTIKSTEVFQRINTARNRQDERMARWVEKKLFPRPITVEFNPQAEDYKTTPPMHQIMQLLTSVIDFKEEARSASQSSNGDGRNTNELVDNLILFTIDLRQKLKNMETGELIDHLESNLMQYEVQTLQQLARGVSRSTINKLGAQTIRIRASAIDEAAQAILDQMRQAPIDTAYFGADSDLKEPEKPNKSADDKDAKRPEPSKDETKDRATTEKKIRQIFSESAPNFTAGFHYIRNKIEKWEKRQRGEDHVALETDLHQACLRFRLEVVTCLKRLEDDPLIKKYGQKTLETLKGNVEFASSTIAKLETSWATGGEGPTDAESGSVSR